VGPRAFLKVKFVVRERYISIFIVLCLLCFIVLLTYCSFFSITFDGVCPSLIKLIVIVRNCVSLDPVASHCISVDYVPGPCWPM